MEEHILGDTDPILPNLEPNPINLDLPITLRKGVRNCTKHPLDNFLSYHRLSPTHKSFLTSMDAIVITKSVEEALKDPKWK